MDGWGEGSMSVSLRSILPDETRSLHSASRSHGIERPFSVRELITPLSTGTGSVPFVDATWSNWVGDFEQEGYVAEPESRAELVQAVRAHSARGSRVRAVGSGHSHSRASEPPEDYVDLTELSGTLPKRWLADDVDGNHLVRVKAGTILKQLNRQMLADRNLALHNMGSFDGQTVAGAVNTATHGTGLDLGSIADSVRSVELVTVVPSVSDDPIVRMFRIEPRDGITDRAAFEADTAAHGMTLIQDEDVFHAAVVGYGCMGIAYAYTLDVRDCYWLEESSHLEQWSSLSRKLSSDSVAEFVGRSRHLQILVNLPIVQDQVTVTWAGEEIDPDDPICLVRRHDVDHDPPEQPAGWSRRWPPERRQAEFRDIVTQLKSVHPLKPNETFGKRLHNNFFEPEANRAPFVGGVGSGHSSSAWYIALRRLRDEKNSPPDPPSEAISTEVAVPLDQVVPAVNAVFSEVRQVTQVHTVDPVGGSPYEGEFDVYYGVPMGIRFVAESDHYLSPEFERRSAMIEVPFPVTGAAATLRPAVPNLSKTEMREQVAKPALRRIERLLVEEFDGRPHMGKVHSMAEPELASAYSQFDGESGSWMETYERFNAFGTFDNGFTDALRISRSDGE